MPPEPRGEKAGMERNESKLNSIRCGAAWNILFQITHHPLWLPPSNFF
jgi:hypothetical protein